MSSLSPLRIDSIDVRQERDGMFSLNDLHAASGGAAKHSPNHWSRNKQIQELIEEIKKTRICVIESKQGLGTFICKELVYAYAMWVSPAFHLKVIQTFDQAVTRPASAVMSLPDFTDPAAAARAWADAIDQKRAAEKQLALAAPTVQAFERIAVANDSVTMTEAAKSLQMAPSELMGWLNANGWIYRRVGAKAWSAYQDKINTGLMEHKVTVVEREDGTEKMVHQARVTPKGLTKLAKIFAEGGAE